MAKSRHFRRICSLEPTTVDKFPAAPAPSQPVFHLGRHPDGDPVKPQKAPNVGIPTPSSPLQSARTATVVMTATDIRITNNTFLARLKADNVKSKPVPAEATAFGSKDSLAKGQGGQQHDASNCAWRARSSSPRGECGFPDPPHRRCHREGRYMSGNGDQSANPSRSL